MEFDGKYSSEMIKKQGKREGHAYALLFLGQMRQMRQMGRLGHMGQIVRYACPICPKKGKVVALPLAQRLYPWQCT